MKAGQKRWLYDYLSLNSIDVKHADFSELNNRKQHSSVTFAIHQSNYGTRSENRLFVPVNSLNRWDQGISKKRRSRTDDIPLTFSFSEKDTYLIRVPSGFKLEARPDSVLIQNDFGSYRLITSDIRDGTIRVSRELTIKKRKLPADKYDALQLLFDRVKNYDAQNILLREI